MAVLTIKKRKGVQGLLVLSSVCLLLCSCVCSGQPGCAGKPAAKKAEQTKTESRKQPLQPAGKKKVPAAARPYVQKKAQFKTLAAPAAASAAARIEKPRLKQVQTVLRSERRDEMTALLDRREPAAPVETFPIPAAHIPAPETKKLEMPPSRFAETAPVLPLPGNQLGKHEVVQKPFVAEPQPAREAPAAISTPAPAAQPGARARLARLAYTLKNPSTLEQHFHYSLRNDGLLLTVIVSGFILMSSIRFARARARKPIHPRQNGAARKR